MLQGPLLRRATGQRHGEHSLQCPVKGEGRRDSGQINPSSWIAAFWGIVATRQLVTLN